MLYFQRAKKLAQEILKRSLKIIHKGKLFERVGPLSHVLFGREAEPCETPKRKFWSEAGTKP